MAIRLILKMNSEKGTTLVEATMALPLFIFVMLALLDLARIGLVSVTLQFVTASALRAAAVGVPAGDSAVLSEIPAGREAAIRQITRRSAEVFGVTLNENQIEICEVDVASPEVCRAAGAGTGGSYVRVRVLASVQLVTLGRRTLQSSAVARNEFF